MGTDQALAKADKVTDAPTVSGAAVQIVAHLDTCLLIGVSLVQPAGH